jgi:tellurite resistance protein TerC/cation:H+ antiporter
VDTKPSLPKPWPDTGWQSHPLVRAARRLTILIVGLTVVLIGIFMIFLPGPAMLVIPAGLFILGLEFAWARRLLAKAKTYVPEKAPRSFREALQMLRRTQP